MNLFIRLLGGVLLVATAAMPASGAETKAPAAAAKPPEPVHRVSQDAWNWDFQLLPNAFSRSPRVDMTVVTEMTDEGRKRPEPSTEHPVYYFAKAGQYRHVGDGVETRKVPTPEEVGQVLKHNLAQIGYLPAEKPGQPVSVIIFYHWGSHTNIEAEFGSEYERTKNLYTRAALVGGRSFADRFAKARYETLRDADLAAMTGVNFNAMFPMASPMARFTDGDARMEHLVAQVGSDVYFVIASAYDAAALAKGQRVLLWRTKMTADSNGVSMRETLPNLIAAAKPYFGRDVPDAEALRQRMNRGANVEWGEPKVLGYEDARGAPAKPVVVPADPKR